MACRVGFAAPLIAATVALAAPPPRAQDSRFMTSDGAVVATPPPQSLDCRGKRRVLDAIDATGYRGTGPEPKNPADRGLLDYENALSQAYYAECLATNGNGPGTPREQ